MVPDPEFLSDWAKRQNAGDDPATLAANDDLRKALHEAIDRVNGKLSVIERVRQIVIAPEPFTIENEMMTPTMKLRRHIITARYGAALEGLYGR